MPDAAYLIAAVALVGFVVMVYLAVDHALDNRAGRFEVMGTDAGGERRVEVEASNVAAARARGQSMGLNVLKVKRIGPGAP